MTMIIKIVLYLLFTLSPASFQIRKRYIINLWIKKISSKHYTFKTKQKKDKSNRIEYKNEIYKLLTKRTDSKFSVRSWPLTLYTIFLWKKIFIIKTCKNNSE